MWIYEADRRNEIYRIRYFLTEKNDDIYLMVAQITA